jgi:hypothetical protein
MIIHQLKKMNEKKISESLYKLLQICNASQPLIFEKIMAGDVHIIKDGFRAYSNYMCSMNMLLGLITEWRFRNKLPNSKVQLESCVEHFKILAASLDELSKKYDYLVVDTAGGEVKSLRDLKSFIENEIHTFENVQIRDTGTKTGSHETVPKWNKQLRKINKVPMTLHKFKLEDGVHIGGAESSQDLKAKILKLQNVKADMSETSKADYYSEVFLPTIAKILDVDLDEVEEQLAQGVSLLPPPEHTLHSELNYINEHELPKLCEYYHMRTGQDYVFSKTISAPTLLKELIQFMNRIHAEDYRVVTEGIKPISEQDVSDNFLLLTSKNFQALARRDYKLRHKKLCDDLSAMLASEPSYNQNIVRLSASEDTNMRMIYDVLHAGLKACIINFEEYQRKELFCDSVAALLKKIVDNILAMIDPTNKQTCIRRTCLLINTIMSAPEEVRNQIIKLYPTQWKPKADVNLLLSSYF